MNTDNNTNHVPAMSPIAIIGMSCFFPKSPSLKDYWRLVYQGNDAITEIPPSHWSPEDYFDDDPKKPDHVYCRRGGFLDPIDFDPSEFGIPPATLEATDTSQLLGLVAAQRALADAGYGDGNEFNHDRTSVILGVTGTQELVIPLGARLGHPIWRKALKQAGISSEKSEEIVSRISDAYVPWQENSFPGLLGNVVAGRIANRLNLGGTNCVVDAACASSMSAIHLAAMELTTGRSDMVLTGGVDALNDIFMHMCFSKTLVLSPSSDIRPFSKNADGTVLGEGVGIIVLKRLEDAERDKDRTYAVIKGIGSSSDGKSQSIYAPRVDGQAKALKSAYNQAQFDPGSIGLIEAHGTGTRVGDKVEVQALSRIFSESHRNGNKCAIGSVKSNIGHTKAAAGAAGLVKTALALHHKVLPPTLKAEEPDPALELDKSPFYLNTESRPWIANENHPRRAGVSAFGFGGSNFHVVLEEYQPAKAETAWIGSADIIALSAMQPGQLIERVKQLQQALSQNKAPQDIHVLAAQSRKHFSAENTHRLLFAFNRDSDLTDDLDKALNFIQSGNLDHPGLSQKIFYGGPEKPGKLAFVFPGQGSQYPGMGRDFVCTFPEAFAVLEQADSKYDGPHQLNDILYPRPPRTPAEKDDQEKALRNTRIAQPAIGAVSLAMLKILQKFNVTPQATCGHSFGELTALCAAGWITETSLLELAVERGRCMASAGGNNGHKNGAMLAVGAPLADLEDLVQESQLDVILANRNSPKQGVLSGSTNAIAKAADICRQKGYKSMTLPVSAAFHSRWVNQAQKPFARTIQAHRFTPNAVSVFANTTGTPYPAEAEKARELLANHLVQPVAFADEIENMYAAGVRTFVEVGPKSVLTGLVKTILSERSHQAIAIDASSGRQCGISDFAKTLCHLAALGYPVDLSEWENVTIDVKQARMRIPIGGANYRSPSLKTKKPNSGAKPEHSNEAADYSLNSDRPETKIIRHPIDSEVENTSATEQKFRNTDIMANQNDEKSPYLTDALRVVQEGLQSIQNLQAQTAQAHQKFLETQTEANRTLQAMMQNTQRLAEASLGLEATPVPVIAKPDVAPDTMQREASPTPDGSIPERRQIDVLEQPTPAHSFQAVLAAI